MVFAGKGMDVKKLFNYSKMIIDTKEAASTLWKAKTSVITVYAVLVFVTAYFIPIDTLFKYMIYGVLSVILLIFFWFQYQMNYTYFYFSNNSKNLVFRFYTLRIIAGKPKTIEISRTNFVKYDIVVGFHDKKDSLVLYQKTPKGMAKYPPISLTLLSKNQKTDLKRTLFAMTNS